MPQVRHGAAPIITKKVKRRLLTQINASMDWREELQRMLIEAGTEGLKQANIVKRFDHWIMTDELTAELEALKAQNKVHRYMLPTKGRSAIVWRATTLILK